MVAPAWVKTVSDWLPVIQLAGLLLLWKYVVDTAAIKRVAHQPLLALDQKLRQGDLQILDQSHVPTPATELADELVVRNVGVGPAIDLIYAFEGLQGTPPMRWTIPYLKVEQGIRLAISKSLLEKGDATFEAIYRSLAGTRYETRLELAGGRMVKYTRREVGIVRSVWLLSKWCMRSMAAKIEERRLRKKFERV